MTICIANVCEGGKAVISTSDHKVTIGSISAEGVGRKESVITDKWTVLVAGDDMTHARPIVTRIKEIVKKGDGSVGALAAALGDAYDERLQLQIEAKYLKRFAMTIEDFRDHGKEKLSATLYDQIVSQISQETLRCQFLVCGFEDNNPDEGHIICLDEDGAPGIYDDVGFWAIGSGAPLALSSLAFHANQSGLNRHTTLEQSIYRITKKVSRPTNGLDSAINLASNKSMIT